MIYSVIVDVSTSQLDRVFDYKSDENLTVGQRVKVNFNGLNTEGFIIAQKQSTDYPIEKVKPILGTLDNFVALSQEMLQLATFMKETYHLRYVDVLRLFVPSEMRGGKVKALEMDFAKLTDSAENILPQIKETFAQQRQIVQYLAKGAEKCSFLNKQFGTSALKTLKKKGFVEIYRNEVLRNVAQQLVGESNKHKLTDQQQKVVDTILSDKQGRYLLWGVTGSGKTEVYMNVIQQLVDMGKNCIMLVPEISLTPNMLRLFRDRFGDTVAILHSGLSKGQRYDEWIRLKTGKAKIAIGARSAVFAPLDNLGAIIIDEEHDSSYYSDSNPRYSTIEVATKRAQLNHALLVLGSATPSLTTFYKAQKGEYKLLQLPSRINKMPLPKVDIVDMRMEILQGNNSVISNKLKDKLAETLKNGNQAILFLNRRGYSSFLMCTKCGYVARCKDCDVTLTVHKESNTLKCHYCNKTYKKLTHCPHCGQQSFKQGKLGTQQLCDILNNLFPDAKLLRMDSDTTTTKESYTKILQEFADQKAQILVGTQMVAKGHDFPNVTLVGIIDADIGLYSQNYLANERCFQLLTQVAGRSGRNALAGSVVLQTYTPQHYCLTLASRQDYLSFYQKEIGLRDVAKFPPFSSIVRVLYTCENEQDCIDQVTLHASKFEQIKAENPDAFYFMDKMRCQIRRAEGKFRFQILFKLDNDYFNQVIDKIFAVCDVVQRKNVRVFVEVDPQDVT
ncbi:MAG: primosomal protein N' [Clostridia bacterium]|nr:primosomal protein N' [Clostridia bacterium]